MTTCEITLSQVLFGVGAGVLIAVINWAWWKRKNRKDLNSLRFFLNHQNEIEEYINRKVK